MNDTTRTKPAATVRIGALEAAIWRRQGKNGPWYNFTVSRSYKDKDGQWNNADSFGKDDALLLAKLADRAHDRILELEATDRKAARHMADTQPAQQEEPAY